MSEMVESHNAYILKLYEFIERQGIVSAELCIIMDNIERILKERQQEKDLLKKQNEELLRMIMDHCKYSGEGHYELGSNIKQLINKEKE